MKKPYPSFPLFLLICLALPLTATAQVVDILDFNLRTAIEKALGKASGATITTADMAKLTHLEAKNSNISDLTGLEFATNLTSLDLGPEKVANEWRNSNAVKDLSPLAGLTQLTSLHLPNNSISDISAVAGLTNLTWLNLWGNSVSDISAVTGLTNLKDLYLGDNNISDLSPLVANTGLGSGDTINVQSNPLSYQSIHTHIPTLQSRGVPVEFDDTTHLNIGEPRTVRIIYFLPNDRPYRADVEQRAKDHVRKSQIFFAEQMRAHGYGNKTFRVETDSEGEPMVHRVAGQYPNSHYSSYMQDKVLDEVRHTFDLNSNLYYIVLGTDGGFRRYDGKAGGGTGQRWGKVGGFVMASDALDFGLTAHELGHAFGLLHDFRDGSYLMSYGSVVSGSRDRLAMCHADFLDASPYFNPDTPIKDLSAPTIKLISPRTYPADAKSIPIRLQVSDSEGLHQAILYTAPYNGPTVLTNDSSVTACFGLAGKKETVIDFDYDGIVPFVHNPSYSSSNLFVHPIHVDVVDTSGNMTQIDFLLFSEALEPLMKISGDNQIGLPNKPLPVPFVIEVWDVNSGHPRSGISITFTVITGAGTLSVTHTTTNDKGRAESTLTLGANLEANIVSVSAVGIEQTVTFTAVAGAAVDIPDQNLRAAVETTLGKAEDDPIAPSEMATLTRLEADNANISDLTGLEHATNLTNLLLGETHVEGVGWINSNSVSDLSPLSGLTNLTGLWLERNAFTDISPLAGLTNLTELNLGGNNLSNISPVAGLTNLRQLWLWDNNISDISPVAGLTNLIELILQSNAISDISPVAGLTNLTGLWLAYNNISDISPLVANTGLGSGDRVFVNGNLLSFVSIKTHVPALQSRGVIVEFDTQPHPALLKISGNNQNGVSSTPLSQPFIVEAQDDNGSALAGVSVTFAVVAGGGTLSTTITRTNENGRAQSILTLGPNLGTNTVRVSAAGIQGTAIFHAISDTESPPITADLNNDGSVNILDLIVVASELGNIGTNLVVDVNRDGVVSILDLILVAGMFEGATAAPAAQLQVSKTLTAVEVQGWLTDARALEVRDPIMKQGFVVLEQLLIALTPRETELLSNYPNPFNPETWIPYRLAEDAFVTLTIYDGSGQVIRTLEVGHRIAAAYENRSKAIYWDGRNDMGEWVASGVYFYQLRVENSRSETEAGDYSATRKMVILK